MQSPVFEAMLHGDFKEANQEKIFLHDDDPDSMVDFFKLLYPYKMFEYPLDEENLLAMLSLADKYQTEAVITQCFDEVTITSDNAVQVLPYASKYNQDVCEECINIAQKEVSTYSLEKSLPNIDHSYSYKILVGKCKLLEDIVLRARNYLYVCMEIAANVQRRHKARSEVTFQCSLSHELTVYDILKIGLCDACQAEYRRRFCKLIAEENLDLDNGETLFNFLGNMHEMVQGVLIGSTRSDETL